MSQSKRARRVPGTGCASSPAKTAESWPRPARLCCSLAAAALASTWQAILRHAGRDEGPASSGPGPERSETKARQAQEVAQRERQQAVTNLYHAARRGSGCAPPRPRHGLPDAGLQPAATSARARYTRQGHRPAPPGSGRLPGRFCRPGADHLGRLSGRNPEDCPHAGRRTDGHRPGQWHDPVA